MRRMYLYALVIGIVLTVEYAILHVVSWLLVPVSDLTYSIISGSSAALAFLVVRKWGVTGRFGYISSGIFLAMLFWFLGETTWAVYEVGLDVQVPYPSFADVFYLAGYVPMIIGMIQFLLFFGKDASKRRLLAACVAGLVVAGLTFSFLLVPLSLSDPDILTRLLDLLYPILDAILLTLSIFVFFTFEGGSIGPSWLWISIGVLLFSVADILFSLGTLEGWYFSGHPIELLWLYGYIGFGLGFADQMTAMDRS